MQTRQCKCLLVAQILQTGLDHPNAIILHSMWARARCYIWARIKNNLAQIGASSVLFYFFIFFHAQIARTFGPNVADSGHIWPRYGMAEHIWAKLSPYLFCHSFRIGGNSLLDDNNFEVYGPYFLINLRINNTTLHFPIAYNAYAKVPFYVHIILQSFPFHPVESRCVQIPRSDVTSEAQFALFT